MLGTVDRVLAEDTRRTGQLLAHFGLSTPQLSLHEHNERERVERVVAGAGGARIALVSDAGTPAVSDPGMQLVRAAREAGVEIESVPGPSALAAALAASGFPAEPSLFLGFPPARSGERKRWLAPWAETPATLVFYEAPHRAEGALADLAELLGEDRKAILLRELSKLHEEGIDGTLGSIRDEVARRGGVKGELVIVVAPPPEESTPAEEISDEELASRVAALEAEGLPRNEALRRAAKGAGLSRSEAYRRLHGGKG